MWANRPHFRPNFLVVSAKNLSKTTSTQDYKVNLRSNKNITGRPRQHLLFCVCVWCLFTCGNEHQRSFTEVIKTVILSCKPIKGGGWIALLPPVKVFLLEGAVLLILLPPWMNVGIRNAGPIRIFYDWLEFRIETGFLKVSFFNPAAEQPRQSLTKLQCNSLEEDPEKKAECSAGSALLALLQRYAINLFYDHCAIHFFKPQLIQFISW